MSGFTVAEARRARAQAAMSSLVRDVPDYPQPGIVFKDITPMLADHAAFAAIIEALAYVGRDAEGRTVVDTVVGMEARGFILAAPVALALGVGFVPVRKQGRLPRATHAVCYDLEYGSATLEIHQDAVEPGDRVLLIDDVLATGGTAAATVDLIEKCGGRAHALGVLIELGFLPGRAAVGDLPVTSMTIV
jgi:adenine phosphoribosyltransferase